MARLPYRHRDPITVYRKLVEVAPGMFQLVPTGEPDMIPEREVCEPGDLAPEPPPRPPAPPPPPVMRDGREVPLPPPGPDELRGLWCAETCREPDPDPEPFPEEWELRLDELAGRLRWWRLCAVVLVSFFVGAGAWSLAKGLLERL